jgi:hypothetical protein
MGMKIRNQRGFTAVEGLVILSVVVILGGAGFYVWHKNKNSKPVTSTSQTTQTTTPSPNYPIAKAGIICTDFPATGECETADKTKYQFAKITTTANNVAWSILPADLQTASTATWNSDCMSVPDASMATLKGSQKQFLLNNDDKFAEIPIGCGEYGGALHLMVKVSGVWKSVAVTQIGGWPCETISQYKIPNSFLASPDGYTPTCWLPNASQGRKVL